MYIETTHFKGRAGEPEPVGAGCFGSLEPEPEQIEEKNRSRSRLEKKSGAGAAKKLAGSSALREDSIRKLYFSYSSLGNILSFMVSLSFMVKKKIILLVHIFLQFYLTSLRGKESGGAGAARKKIPGAGAAILCFLALPKKPKLCCQVQIPSFLHLDCTLS